LHNAARANVHAPSPAVSAPIRAPASGSVQPLKIKATVLSHASEVQACYERAQMERAELHGHILLRATLDGQGNVTDSATPDVFQGGARLAACIASAARHWKFPAPAGGASPSVSYRFVFD
jgi:hypothetical protein